MSVSSCPRPSPRAIRLSWDRRRLAFQVRFQASWIKIASRWSKIIHRTRHVMLIRSNIILNVQNRSKNGNCTNVSGRRCHVSLRKRSAIFSHTICYIAVIFPATTHAFIGQFMVIWHLTMKLFTAKRHERATLRKLWHQTGNSGCFPLCQIFRKFRSEFKWKGSFRFLLTGIFGITSGVGPHISVPIFRPKFIVPFLTNRFFALIREFGKRI